MSLYVISCALQDSSHDYSPLWSALDRMGSKRAMDAVWLLNSNDPIASLTETILPMLEGRDQLLIAEVGVWSATNLLSDAQEFLRKLTQVNNV